MKNCRLYLLVAVSLLVGSAQSPGQRQSRLPSKHSGSLVMGDFVPKQVESLQDQQHRQIRERRYGDRLSKPLVDPGLVDPGLGQTVTDRPVFIDYVIPNNPDPQGFPASVSTAVVVGTILSGKCFINKAHTFVYTDYQVRIDQVLKPDPATHFTVGDLVIAARPGGAIHFPSGHITNVFNVGHGLPEIGSQYVLFLWKSIPNLPEYEIVIDSAYQLQNGRAYPLDDANSQYDGVDVNALLGKVQKAVAASQGVSQ